MIGKTWALRACTTAWSYSRRTQSKTYFKTTSMTRSTSQQGGGSMATAVAINIKHGAYRCVQDFAGLNIYSHPSANESHCVIIVLALAVLAE